MSYKHLLGLPLRHKISDIKGLFDELQTLMKLDGSRVMTGNLKLDTYEVVWSDVKLKRMTTGGLIVSNVAGDARLDFMCHRLFPDAVYLPLNEPDMPFWGSAWYDKPVDTIWVYNGDWNPH